MSIRIKTLLAALALTLAGTSAQAQDLLARQAPVDKKMKMVDSLSLRRMFQENAPSRTFFDNLENPSSHLYPTWDNGRGRTYGVTMPREFSIDLRGFSMPCDSRLVTSSYG